MVLPRRGRDGECWPVPRPLRRASERNVVSRLARDASGGGPLVSTRGHRPSGPDCHSGLRRQAGCRDRVLPRATAGRRYCSRHSAVRRAGSRGPRCPSRVRRQPEGRGMSTHRAFRVRRGGPWRCGEYDELRGVHARQRLGHGARGDRRGGVPGRSGRKRARRVGRIDVGADGQGPGDERRSARGRRSGHDPRHLVQACRGLERADAMRHRSGRA